MFLDSVSSIPQLPQPALGLLPAVHDATVVEAAELPTTSLTGNVWKATGALTLPAYNRWPARQVAIGEHFAHDGRLFYKVRQRLIPAGIECGITLDGTTATAVADSAHGLTTGDSVTVYGATQAAYNGTFEALVLSDTEFEYTVSGSPASPATASSSAGGPYVRPKETSWYPDAFERTLYTIHFSPKQLVLGANYRFERQFDFRLIANSTNAVWSVVCEIGQRTTQTSPGPIGPNLMDYEWREPLLEQQVVITDVMCSHQLGVQIWNLIDGYTGKRLLYDTTLGCTDASLPTAYDFALRVRLSCFDTQNSVTDPKGYVAYVAKPIPS
jgi:hypothetical protein